MGIGIWQIVIIIFWFVLVGYPIARIIGRIGFSRWMVILAFVPIANLVFLWVLAYVKWPVEFQNDPAADPRTFE